MQHDFTLFDLRSKIIPMYACNDAHSCRYSSLCLFMHTSCTLHIKFMIVTDCAENFAR